MSYLVDTSVLVRTIHPTSPLSPVALDALTALYGRGEVLCIIPQNVIEFWAVVTRPTTSNGLGLSTEGARREVSKIKAMFVLQPDAPAIFSFWERLVVNYQVSGKPTHDARLVAAMQAHGITHLLTFNVADFRRYADIITVVAPSDV